MFCQFPKMSNAIDFIPKKLPGFGSLDGRCLPCSGLSGRKVTSYGEYKHLSKAKILNLKSSYKRTTFICNASFSNHKRNPDFSRQNKHGFSRGRNRQNEDRDGYDNLEESELISSKNGPLLTTSNTSKFQATAAPGPREKEIVELFRKVQAQLRERAAVKEERKSEELQGKGKESETVDSLLKLLRKQSVQKGKKTSSNRGSNFVLDQPDQSNVFLEECSGNITDLKSTVNRVVQDSGTTVKRLKSNFQRRSPVLHTKFQPAYHEGTDKPVASTTTDKAEKDIHLDRQLGQISKDKVDSDAEYTEPIFSDDDVFDEMADDDTAKMYGNVDANNDDEQNQVGDVLAEMKLTELRAIAKSRGLKGYSKLRKVELIELLSADQV